MDASEIFAWLMLLVVSVLVLSIAQYLMLYVRRRWARSVRLPNPTGYLVQISVEQGIPLQLACHTTEPAIVHIERCGADGYIRLESHKVAPTRQSSRYDHWKGLDWTLTISIPTTNLEHGFYRLVLQWESDPVKCWSSWAVVRATKPQPIVVLASTNTWNAYNSFGGLSNYLDRATPWPLRGLLVILKLLNIQFRLGDRHWLPIVPLPTQRPNIALHEEYLATGRDVDRHLAMAESALISFLEREKVAYDIITDHDFARAAGTADAKLLLLNTHAEYWSYEMLARLNEVQSQGVASIAVLSGNNAYRRVQFLDSAITVVDQLVSDVSIAPQFGSFYDALGYHTNAGYRVVAPDHWVFHGLGAAYFGRDSTEHKGASGNETDKLSPCANNFRTIAIGENSEGPAYMVCSDKPDGRFFLNVSSVAFTWRLNDDPGTQSVVRNIVSRALAAADNRP